MNIKCLLAYDGSAYFGWQKTKIGPSIEETLEKTLFQILQEPIKLQAASRTDRGVHAEGQVANFLTQKSLDLDKLQASLRSLLPKDISLISLEEKNENFHPTLDCLSKEYHYWIFNDQTQFPIYRNFSWHVPSKLNMSLVKEAAKILSGTHDFSAFSTKKYSDPIRHIHEISLKKEDKRLCFCIKGTTFLYKMIRILVGTLVYVGIGKLSLEKLPEILEGKKRKAAGITAPAHGLFLKKVFY